MDIRRKAKKFLAENKDKANKIWAMYAKGEPTSVIADAIGVCEYYVLVALNKN